MINFDGKELQEEFNTVFSKYEDMSGMPLEINALTVEQLWWLTKFAKHVRDRCRGYTAFNNFMNHNFSPAQFQEILKEYKDRSCMKLQIKVGDKVLEGDDEE